jgi:uracil-DNA glycosylase
MRAEPGSDCPRCPRLADFRALQRDRHGDWHNAPVPSFGPAGAPLLIVGLAPGLNGANRTGRPFTGDFAGEVLYPALVRHGLARGEFQARVDDGLELTRCRITNAVRCVPPANKPTPAEIRTCRDYLAAELRVPPRPRVVLALGRIAFDSTLRAFGLTPGHWPFAHARRYELPGGPTLVASYHSSRYNVNTGRLTPAMFDDAMRLAAAALDEAGDLAVTSAA